MKFEQYKFKFYLNASHAIYIQDVLGESHPHTWELAIYTLRRENSFIAFHEMENKVEALLDPYQDGFLNQMEPFTTVNPTLENCCEHFKNVIRELLRSEGWELLQIEMSETPTRAYIIDLLDEIDG